MHKGKNNNKPNFDRSNLTLFCFNIFRQGEVIKFNLTYNLSITNLPSSLHLFGNLRLIAKDFNMWWVFSLGKSFTLLSPI